MDHMKTLVRRQTHIRIASGSFFVRGSLSARKPTVGCLTGDGYNETKITDKTEQ